MQNYQTSTNKLNSIKISKLKNYLSYTKHPPQNKELELKNFILNELLDGKTLQNLFDREKIKPRHERNLLLIEELINNE